MATLLTLRSPRRPLLLLVALVAACTADHYRRDADLEVGEIIDRNEEHLFGRASGFTIETAHDALRQLMVAELEAKRAARVDEMRREVVPPLPEPSSAPSGPVDRVEVPQDEALREENEALANADRVQEQLEERLRDAETRHAGELRAFEVTAAPLLPQRVLSLDEALQVASDNSREYQTQKEQVYLVALDLTFQRYLFDARFGVSSNYQWTSSPGDPRQRDGRLTTNFSITQALASGGLLVFDFTNSILHRFTGIDFGNGNDDQVTSVADLTFTQPLLQGFGRDVAQEPLIQAEREAVYQLRAFERFRQEFAVGVATAYYDLVQQIDTIANNRRAYIQNIDAREQSEALAARGRRSQIELDQATQQELSTRNSWIVAQRSYQDQLDRFKITLGLPMDANLAPDPAELQELRDAGLVAVDLREDPAIQVALAQRLDHINVIERFEDSERQVNVSADDLRAALDLNAGVAIPTEESYLDFRGSQATWTAGATLDLPVDKLQERNAYRAALIFRERSARDVSLSEDQVKESVRDDLRQLAQLQETYRIALESVRVAERRVQSTALTLRMGRIQIRDALDATSALNSARNALTSAFVDYEIARLQLALDSGLLALGPEGIVVRTPADPPGGP